MQHQIRSKTNFVLQAISKHEADISKTESSVISTNDIVATVGFRYEGTKEVKWVVRRSLVFGREWEVRVPKKKFSHGNLRYAIRDEIQCDWWLKNWANNRIEFEKAEREEARCHREQRGLEGCAQVLASLQLASLGIGK